MKILSKYAFLVFIMLLINAIILELFLSWAEQFWRIFGLNIYNFIVLVYSPLVIFLFFRITLSRDIKENKILLLIILIYSLYQIVYNLPMTLVTYANHVGVKWISELNLRLSLLQIPLFYWFLFKYNSEEKLLRLLELTAILMLLFGIYNYTQGQYNITNTGEIRIVSGIVSIYCFILLFNNIKILGANKNNLIFLFIALLGIILSAHRSTYLSVIIVILFYILLRKKGFGKFNTVMQLTFIIIIFGLLTFLIPGVSEIFISRAKNIADIQDYNYYDRYIKNLLAYEMFLKNPVNGTYLSGFYYDVAAVREEFFWKPHNFIFEILPTQGVIGLFFIIIILFQILKISWGNREDRYSELSFFILLYYILIGLTNASFLYNSSSIILTFFSALILWRNKILKTKLQTL